MSKYVRKLGPGPSTPTAGDMDNGYFGKVTGIITGNDLKELTGISNTLSVTGDITWLKFKVDGRTLFVADRNISTSISWNQINTAGCVRGEKVFDLNGVKYCCRLLTGGNQTVASSAGGEWDNTIVKYTPNNADSNWSGLYSWCQEVHSTSTSYRIIRGNNSVSNFVCNNSSSAYSEYGWRPTLEVL